MDWHDCIRFGNCVPEKTCQELDEAEKIVPMNEVVSDDSGTWGKFTSWLDAWALPHEKEKYKSIVVHYN